MRRFAPFIIAALASIAWAAAAARFDAPFPFAMVVFLVAIYSLAERARPFLTVVVPMYAVISVLPGAMRAAHVHYNASQGWAVFAIVTAVAIVSRLRRDWFAVVQLLSIAAALYLATHPPKTSVGYESFLILNLIFWYALLAAIGFVSPRSLRVSQPSVISAKTARGSGGGADSRPETFLSAASMLVDRVNAASSSRDDFNNEPPNTSPEIIIYRDPPQPEDDSFDKAHRDHIQRVNDEYYARLERDRLAAIARQRRTDELQAEQQRQYDEQRRREEQLQAQQQRRQQDDDRRRREEDQRRAEEQRRREDEQRRRNY